jgi:hypothetical protein
MPELEDYGMALNADRELNIFIWQHHYFSIFARQRLLY